MSKVLCRLFPHRLLSFRDIISTPYPIRKLWFAFEAHIVDADDPVLFSNDDTDGLSISLDKLSKFLIDTAIGMKVQVTDVNGHVFFQWNPRFSCMLTSVEFRRCHCRFGHPSTEMLMIPLSCFKVGQIGLDTRRILKKIKWPCNAFQINSQKPHRYKFTFCDEKYFDHIIYASVLR